MIPDGRFLVDVVEAETLTSGSKMGGLAVVKGGKLLKSLKV